MNFTFSESKIKTIQPGHKHFMIRTGLTLAPRASFEISRSCPNEYKTILMQAVNAGWLKPIAHVTSEEYMVMQLSQ